MFNPPTPHPAELKAQLDRQVSDAQSVPGRFIVTCTIDPEDLL